MLLSPIAGIYINLQLTKIQAPKKNNLTLVEEFIAKADGFELDLINKLIDSLTVSSFKNSEDKKQFSILQRIFANLKIFLASYPVFLKVKYN